MGKKQHHGGAWKIAYADFMTAMMAFFLLLWLLSFSEEDKLTGIANYFKPSEVTLTNVGGQGVMSGTSAAEDDLLGESVPAAETPPQDVQDMARPGAQAPEETPPDKVEAVPAADAGAGEENPWTRLVRQEAAVTPAGTVARELADIRERLSPFAETVKVHERNGNVIIDMLDLSQSPMFVSGSAELTGANEAVAREIAAILVSMGGSITITGHTDAVPYGNRPDGYGNWELSADRANAVRRAMVSMGVDADRITRVSGVAETEPLPGTAAEAAENRRVSIEIVSGV